MPTWEEKEGTVATAAEEVLARIQKSMSGVWKRDRHTIDVFMDFEFWDRGNLGLHTISGGLVLVAGGFNNVPYQQKRFYFINTDFFEYLDDGFDTITREYRSGNENAKWLHEHVFKYIHANVYGELKTLQWIQDNEDVEEIDLDLIPDPNLGNGEIQSIASIRSGAVRRALQSMVDSFGISTPQLRIWGYYPAHDHVCLCSIFGAMVDMPEEWSFYDYDLRAMTDIYGYEHDDFNPDPAQPHHALHDAYSQYLTTRKLFEHLRNDNLIDFPSATKF